MVIGRTRLSQPIHMQSFNVAVECTVTFGREGIAAKLRTKMLRAYGLGKCRCDRVHGQSDKGSILALGSAARVACTMRCTYYHPLART